MKRIGTCSAFCVAFALICALGTSQAQAGGRFVSSATYDSGYFHDYHNYGARYSHRPEGSYYGNYGGSHQVYYGGWNEYRPYAYSQPTQTVSVATPYPAGTQTVGYHGGHAGGCNSCAAPEPCCAPAPCKVRCRKVRCRRVSCCEPACPPAPCAPVCEPAPCCPPPVVVCKPVCDPCAPRCGGGLLGRLCPLNLFRGRCAPACDPCCP